MASLAEHLHSSAARYVRRSVDAYLRDAYDEFCLFAGTAVEHAAKARLAEHNSVFLAPDRPFQSSVALHRMGGDIGTLPPGVRTVGAVSALTRLGDLEPRLRSDLEAVKGLVAIRNGEAHLGLHPQERTSQLFAAFVTVARRLLKDPDLDLWAPHEDLINAVLDKTAADHEREYERKIAAARAAIDRKWGELSDSQVTVLKELIRVDRDGRLNYDDTWDVECPACSSPALFHGETEAIEWNPGTGYVEDFLFDCERLECQACGLRVSVREGLPVELFPDGNDSVWINDAIEVEDWMKRHYLDWPSTVEKEENQILLDLDSDADDSSRSTEEGWPYGD